MRFNLRWLKDYLDTPLSYHDLLEAVTMCGLEVESALDLGAGGAAVVVGEIVEKGPHPNADKLSLCRVNTGGPEPLQIVCGATNIEAGQKVPVALVGATLPDGMTLKPTKIRGVESFGMMCSAKELGVADDHSGIWIQPADMPVGEPFDALIDIKITPNRPDALSLVGIARDIAAKTGGKLKPIEVKFDEAAEKADEVAKVIVNAREDCPRYTARVIRGVKIGPSPMWLQRRLEAAGMRPRNNVVDVTNFVMLEMGHPLHAFDMDTLAQRTVVVRNAKAGEKLGLLDDSEVELIETDLVIADPEKAIALAGIMGGGNTEISDGTTNVLLESAYFRPATIRRTSKRLDKSTDSSYRFERGTDARKLVLALHRAASLIAELAGGEILKSHIDVVGRLPEVEPIKLRLERLNRLSGLQLTGRQATEILARLGFDVQRATEAELVVAVPSHRPDVSMEADLIEEVTRIHGYDKIPYTIPNMVVAREAEPAGRAAETRVTPVLASMGLTQAINLSFASEGAFIAMGHESTGAVGVRNPLRTEHAFMRRSLLPGLLENVAHNFNHGVEDVRLFEVGRTYQWAEDEEGYAAREAKSLDAPAIERTWLTAVIAGGRKADWRIPARDFDFFDIKGIAESVAESLGITRVVIERVEDIGHLHPGRAAALLKGGERLCWFGELHPSLAKELDFRRRVYVMEFPLEGAALDEAAPRRYRPLPKFPPVKRDIALVADRTVAALDLERTIRSASKSLLQGVRLFDVYEGEHMEAGKRSLAFALTFRSDERTLTDEEVVAETGRILAELEKRHGVRLR